MEKEYQFDKPPLEKLFEIAKKLKKRVFLKDMIVFVE